MSERHSESVGLRRAAYHEAAHAVVAEALGMRVARARIGLVPVLPGIPFATGGGVSFENDHASPIVALAVAYAAAVATQEGLFVDDLLGDVADVTAAGIILDAMGEWGESREEVEERARAAAAAILRERWGVVRTLAEELLRSVDHTLSGDAVRLCISRAVAQSEDAPGADARPRE